MTGARTSEPLISLEGVSKSYGTSDGRAVEAVAEVSLRVGRGEFVSIVGRSGCGKTTLLRMIAGLLPPTKGSVAIGGRTVTSPTNEARLVYQKPLLMPWRNSLENILLPLELKGRDTKPYEKRAAELMAEMKLAGFERMYPKELSGGMQQRVSLARALIDDPQILLMDEPFGSLDELTREELEFDLVQWIEVVGKTAVFVTHSVPEAVLLSDRVVVLSPRPSTVELDLEIDIPRPRHPSVWSDKRFVDACQAVRTSLGMKLHEEPRDS